MANARWPVAWGSGASAVSPLRWNPKRRPVAALHSPSRAGAGIGIRSPLREAKDVWSIARPARAASGISPYAWPNARLGWSPTTKSQEPRISRRIIAVRRRAPGRVPVAEASMADARRGRRRGQAGCALRNGAPACPCLPGARTPRRPAPVTGDGPSFVRGEWREDAAIPWAETVQGTAGQGDRGTSDGLTPSHSCQGPHAREVP